jgi:hypothetical protein
VACNARTGAGFFWKVYRAGAIGPYAYLGRRVNGTPKCDSLDDVGKFGETAMHPDFKAWDSVGDTVEPAQIKVNSDLQYRDARRLYNQGSADALNLPQAPEGNPMAGTGPPIRTGDCWWKDASHAGLCGIFVAVCSMISTNK